MKKRQLPSWIFVIILLCIPVNCFTQKIENVVSEISGSTINIYYDLLEIANDQPVIIRVFLSTDGGKSYGEPLKSVSGDVGVVIGAGERKYIIWDVFKEVDELVSESVKFRVKADLLLSDQEKQQINPGYMLSLNAYLGSKVHLTSYGFNLKATISIKQFGLGLRGEFYKTFGEHPDDANFGYYVGFSGGAIVEYDFIRNPKYSLYPFLNVGQTKIEHKSESITSEYSGYSIFYSPGVGFDFNLAKFIHLGVELEYYLAPLVDINDQEGSEVIDRIVLDGFCAGITLKFVKQPGK